jgi:hypothetical protein
VRRTLPFVEHEPPLFEAALRDGRGLFLSRSSGFFGPNRFSTLYTLARPASARRNQDVPARGSMLAALGTDGVPVVERVERDPAPHGRLLNLVGVLRQAHAKEPEAILDTVGTPCATSRAAGRTTTA